LFQVRSFNEFTSGLALHTVDLAMDGFVTVRFPTLQLPVEDKKSSEAAGPCPPATGPTDEALMEGICRGNTEALSILFRRYARIVRGVAYKVVRDPSEADDLLQDIFLLVHHLCRTFDSSKGSVRVWMLHMTYRRAISRRRYLTSRHFYNTVDIDDVAETLKDLRSEKNRFETSLQGSLAAGRLEQAFETLSEGQRQTIWLHFFEGCTLEEIASKLGQSRANIKHHYFRGLERLRKQIFGGKL
jgi:RNA polymerase sigma-70 factor, ECF subfamily